MSSGFRPEIVAFCCGFCGYRSADLAGLTGALCPPEVKVVEVPCSGRVDILHLLRALEDGADGVFVAGCIEGNCHFLTGSTKAEKRVAALKQALGEMGIHPDRAAMFKLSMADPAAFAVAAEEMKERIAGLGASPIRTGSGSEFAPEKAA